MCEDTRGTPKKQHNWIWRLLCSRTANQIASKTILLSLSLFPLPLFSVVLVWTELEKRNYPPIIISLALSLSLFLSVLWWDKQWKDEPVIQHQTWVTWQLKLWVHESLTFTSTPAHTHVYMQHIQTLSFLYLNKNGCIFSRCFLIFAKTLYSCAWHQIGCLDSRWMIGFILMKQISSSNRDASWI